MDGRCQPGLAVPHVGYTDYPTLVELEEPRSA